MRPYFAEELFSSFGKLCYTPRGPISFLSSPKESNIAKEKLSSINNPVFDSTFCEDKIECLFIGEKFQGQDYYQLLDRIIAFMGEKDFCNRQIFIDMNLEQDQEYLKVQSQIWDMNPKVIVLLGAGITNIFLKKKEKLSRIHGKCFEVQFSKDDGKKKSYSCFPIFHLNLLRINPNMKRSAWIDLKKIKEYLLI